jgi:RNA polymerase sigma-70 factor (ECF subfamily)
MPGLRRSEAVTFQDDLELYAPRLLRYARGLAAGRPGAADLADDLVRATFASRTQIGLFTRWFDLELGLYALLTKIHRDALRTGSLGAWRRIETGHFCAGGVARPERASGGGSRLDRIAAAIGALALEEREALLLVAVEGFSYRRAARILKISRRVLVARLARARTAIAQFLGEPGTLRSGKVRPAHLHLVE